MSIITRFPPEPSGFMHLGHMIAVTLNSEFANKFGGKTLLRFDDTNPSKAQFIYENNFLNNLNTFGFQFFKITHTSDSFLLFLDYVSKLIKDGNAYVDASTKDEIKYQRKNKLPSPSRDNSIDINLALYQNLLNGLNNFVIRAKIDPSSDNGSLRDPVLYRYCSDIHYRSNDTKYPYKIYPTYDFSCPILDSLDGITHTFRTTEYEDRTPLYYWILDKLNLRKPLLKTFASLKFKNVVLSKRKIQEMINNKIVDGWDDPRLFTIDGLSRRGFHPSTLLDFVKEYLKSLYKAKNPDKYQPCQTSVEQDPHKLYLMGNNYMNRYAPRSTVISSADFYILNISPQFQSYDKEININPKDPSYGKRSIKISDRVYIEGKDVAFLDTNLNSMVTLLNSYTVKIIAIDHNTKIIETQIYNRNDVDSSYKLTWLSVDNCKNGLIVDYDSNNNLTYSKIFVDPFLFTFSKSSHVQLMRRGNFIIDDIDAVNITLIKMYDTKHNHLS